MADLQHSPSHTGKRKRYTVTFNLAAIDYYLAGNRKSATARHVGVNPKRIREWAKMENKLRDMKYSSSNRTKLIDGGRKVMSYNLEVLLMEYIENLNSQKLRITRKMIQTKAFELFEMGYVQAGHNQETFVASQGWVDNFFKRHTTIRTITAEDEQPFEHVHHPDVYSRKIRLADYTAETAVAAGEMLACKICEYSTDDVSRYNDHLQTHTSDESVERAAKLITKTDEMLECKTCDYSTGDITNYNAHLQTHASDNGSADSTPNLAGTAGDVLRDKTPDVSKYNDHLKALTSDTVSIDNAATTAVTTYVMLECKTCEYSTDDVSKYNSHLQTHASNNNTAGSASNPAGTTDEVLKNKICAYSPNDVSKYNVHFQTHASDTKSTDNAAKITVATCTLLECKTCDYSTDDVSWYNAHLQTHANDTTDSASNLSGTTGEVLKDKTCDYSTDDVSNYNGHPQAHANDTESVNNAAKTAVTTCTMLEAKTCDYSTDDVSKYNAHLQTHTSDTESADRTARAAVTKDELLECKTCEDSTDEISIDKSHIKTNASDSLDSTGKMDLTADEILNCKNDDCSSDDASSDNDHLETHTSDTESIDSESRATIETHKMLECKTCGYSVYDAGGYHAHLKTHCSNTALVDSSAKLIVKTDEMHECKSCDYSTDDVTNYNAHLETHTSDRPTHLMPQEMEVTDNLPNITKDAITQEEKGPTNNLPELPTPALTQEGLAPLSDEKKMLDNKTDEKTCRHCGQHFTNLIQLVRHMLMHRKELRKPMCTQCGKTFRLSTRLMEHMKVMHGPKKVKPTCPYCKKTFRLNRRLKEHMATHAEYIEKQAQDRLKRKAVTVLRQTSVDNNVKKPTPTPGLLKVGSRAWNRLHLKPWLLENLNSEAIVGLKWLDEAKTSFRIPWKYFSNCSQRPFSVHVHNIYIEWAKYMGVFIEREGGPCAIEWAKMKRNLSCALEHEPDLLEDSIKRCIRKDDPYMVYTFVQMQGNGPAALRDRTQDYPGPWCQGLGIRQYDLLRYRLPNKLEEVVIQNGLVLELYDFWAKRQTTKNMLEDLLRLVVPGCSVRGMRDVISYVEYLHERRRNLIACGASQKAKELLQKPFCQSRPELDAAYPKMYVVAGPKVVLKSCQINIPAKENLRKHSYLGPYTKANRITKLRILKGKLRRKKHLCLTNGIMLELYWYWKEFRAPKTELLRWLTGMSAEDMCEDKFFLQVEKLDLACLALVKIGDSGWPVARRVQDSVFRLMDNGPPFWDKTPSAPTLTAPAPVPLLNNVSERTMPTLTHVLATSEFVSPGDAKCTLTMMSPQNVASSTEMASTLEMTSFRCKQPACRRRVKHKVGSKAWSVQSMLCSRHRTPRRSKTEKDNPDGEHKKHKRRKNKTIVIEPQQQDSQMGQQYNHGDESNSNCRTLSVFSEICIVCNFVIQSAPSINIDSVQETWGHLEGMTVRARLEQVLRRPAVGTNWLCTVCNSTLVQLEQFEHRMALFRGQFDQSTQLRSRPGPHNLTEEIYARLNQQQQTSVNVPEPMRAPEMELRPPGHQNSTDGHAAGTLSELARLVYHRQPEQPSASDELGVETPSELAAPVNIQQQPPAPATERGAGVSSGAPGLGQMRQQNCALETVRSANEMSRHVPYHPYSQQHSSANNKADDDDLVIVKEELLGNRRTNVASLRRGPMLADAPSGAAVQSLGANLFHTARELQQANSLAASSSVAHGGFYEPQPLSPNSSEMHHALFADPQLLSPQCSQRHHHELSRESPVPYISETDHLSRSYLGASPSPGDLTNPQPMLLLRNTNSLDRIWTDVPQANVVPPEYRTVEEPRILEITPRAEYI